MTTIEKIKLLCSQNNITINKLEKECGLSRQIIEKWSTSKPRSDALTKIADYFHVSVDYLLGRTENQKPTGEPMGNLQLINELLSSGQPEHLTDKQIKFAIKIWADIVKNLKEYDN